MELEWPASNINWKYKNKRVPLTERPNTFNEQGSIISETEKNEL